MWTETAYLRDGAMAHDLPPLTITRLIRFEGHGALKAYCDLAVGDWMLIRGVRVVKGRNGLFVSMPRQQGKDAQWYDSIVALNKTFRDDITRAVLHAYDQSTNTQANS